MVSLLSRGPLILRSLELLLSVFFFLFLFVVLSTTHVQVVRIFLVVSQHYDKLSTATDKPVLQCRPVVWKLLFYRSRSDITLEPWPPEESLLMLSPLPLPCLRVGITWQQAWVLLKARLQKLWSRTLPWSDSGKVACLLTWFRFCAHPRHRSSQGCPCQLTEGTISSNLIGLGFYFSHSLGVVLKYWLS